MLGSLEVALRAAKTLFCELVSEVNVPWSPRTLASMPSKAACCVVRLCLRASRLVTFCCSTATRPWMIALVLRPLTRPLTEMGLDDDDGVRDPPEEAPDKLESALMIESSLSSVSGDAYRLS